MPVRSGLPTGVLNLETAAAFRLRTPPKTSSVGPIPVSIRSARGTRRSGVSRWAAERDHAERQFVFIMRGLPGSPPVQGRC
jgi:hypothetical protein